MSNHDLDFLNTNANDTINDLYEWFCANKLALNASKTKKYMVIHPKTTKGIHFSKIKLKIGDITLDRIGINCVTRQQIFLASALMNH